MIGYPSGQDGAILPARDYPPSPARNISLKASLVINPLLTKLVRSRWLASFFFREFMDLDSVSVYKQATKELGQYPAILISHLVIRTQRKKNSWHRNVAKLSQRLHQLLRYTGHVTVDRRCGKIFIRHKIFSYITLQCLVFTNSEISPSSVPTHFQFFELLCKLTTFKF